MNSQVQNFYQKLKLEIKMLQTSLAIIVEYGHIDTDIIEEGSIAFHEADYGLHLGLYGQLIGHLASHRTKLLEARPTLPDSMNRHIDIHVSLIDEAESTIKEIQKQANFAVHTETVIPAPFKPPPYATIAPPPYTPSPHPNLEIPNYDVEDDVPSHSVDDIHQPRQVRVLPVRRPVVFSTEPGPVSYIIPYNQPEITQFIRTDTNQVVDVVEELSTIPFTVHGDPTQAREELRAIVANMIDRSPLGCYETPDESRLLCSAITCFLCSFAFPHCVCARAGGDACVCGDERCFWEQTFRGLTTFSDNLQCFYEQQIFHFCCFNVLSNQNYISPLTNSFSRWYISQERPYFFQQISEASRNGISESIESMIDERRTRNTDW